MERVLVLGFGGIAQAVAAKLLENGSDVHIISRQSNSHYSSTVLDMSDEQCVLPLQEVLTAFSPSHVINTIGMLYDEQYGPEKNLNQLKLDWLAKNILVNVMPTVYLGQALNKYLKRSSTVNVLSISARVSSLTDNQLGGWYSYRMSKASLNMLIKNISIEWHRQYPQCGIYAYHPGTVDTNLSKPFQANVPANKLFSGSQAAEYLLEVFSKLTVDKSGCLIDWQGDTLEY